MSDTIQNDTVVHLHYVLTDGDGKELDRSHGDEPLTYLHGHGNIVPGLEEALLGKQVGDALDVVVPPEKAYGPRNGKQQKVPRSAFSAASAGLCTSLPARASGRLKQALPASGSLLFRALFLKT